MSDLKKGYTTGVTAAFAFKSALGSYLITSKTATSKAIKMQNDDLDVTKGCQIVVTITSNKEELKLNPIKHSPYMLNSIEVYAGKGVGVVTKDGLKPKKGYPAINPTPLNAMKKIAESFEIKEKLYCTISVTNGEEIAKQTANEKVGVLGGISILGTTGFVKPVSATAYTDSIKTELNFIKANGYEKAVLTLGNSSLKEALKSYQKEQIVEIGNFVYEAIKEALKRDLEVVLYIGVAKAVKVAQGLKNTHNRFGSIDFKELQSWVKEDIKDAITIKRVLELTDAKAFKKQVKKIAKDMIKEWFNKDIEVVLV